MPVNTHLTDVEVMMTCIISDSSDMIPPVDCGMVDFLERDRRSNLVLPLRFGQGSKPPRRPNIALNMHPNKRCRRSLARPNPTTPEYHDVMMVLRWGGRGGFALMHS